MNVLCTCELELGEWKMRTWNNIVASQNKAGNEVVLAIGPCLEYRYLRSR